MSGTGRESKRRMKGLHSTGSGSDWKYWVALGLYAALGALAWLTLGAGVVFVDGRPVQLRLLPLLVLGGFALRTVIAHHADKIRRDGGDKGSPTR